MRLDWNVDLTMIRSWVVGNAAPNVGGGGINIGNHGSAYIENSVIAGNFSGETAGGVRFDGAGPYRIINSHIVGNVSDSWGSAIAGQGAVIEVTNTLIINNTGNSGIDDPWGDGSIITLGHCDTYGNSPDGTDGVTITRANCLGALQKIGLDPLMAGGALPSEVGPTFAEQWLSYDYRLMPGSPAIDAGTPAGAPATDIDGTPRDAIPDIGAYEGGVTYPVIQSITPNSAFYKTGDLPVTISGYNFLAPISIQLDSVSLLTPTLVSGTTLNAVIPVNDLDVGKYDLVVTSDGEIATLVDAFAVLVSWYVATTGDDSNSCLSTGAPCATINGAIGKASSGDTIYVSNGTYTGTGDEVVLIDKDITLSGGWDASFTAQSGTSTIDGDGVSRGVTVNTGVTATIDHFTVKNGYTDGGGGGIRNFGDLTLTNSIIRDNAAESPGGGIIGRLGSSTKIIDTQIYRNEAGQDGGGIYLDNSDLTLIRSWVVGNAAIG
ncbi:MAG: hypothetical protein JSV61_10905, partial [Anaerolineales bacterium]